MTKTFRIQDGYSIPWAMIEPHETQALRNHGQDLETLHRRGGLGCSEAVAVLEDKPYSEVRGMTEEAARERLVTLVDAWLASPRGENLRLQARVQDLEAALEYIRTNARTRSFVLTDELKNYCERALEKVGD